MSDFGLIASKVSGVLLVMVVGALARWLGWLTASTDKSLAVMTGNVLLPALFLDRIAGSSNFYGKDLSAGGGLFDSFVPPLVGFVCTCIGFLIAWLAMKLFGPLLGIQDTKVQQTFILTVGIANYGYIPIPLAEQFFPDAVVPLLIHNVGIDIALWSLGIMVITGDIRKGWKRVVYSPPLWAMFIAVSLQQLGLTAWLPSPFMQMARSLGQCSIPIGLMLGGAIIVDNWKEVRWSESIPMLVLASGIRLCILPVIFLLIAKISWLPRHLDEVLLLQAAMPAATFPIVLTRLYSGDLPTALRVVVGTSIMGLVTIPLWIVFGKYWLGIS